MVVITTDWSYHSKTDCLLYQMLGGAVKKASGIHAGEYRLLIGQGIRSKMETEVCRALAESSAEAGGVCSDAIVSQTQGLEGRHFRAIVHYVLVG